MSENRYEDSTAWDDDQTFGESWCFLHLHYLDDCPCPHIRLLKVNPYLCSVGELIDDLKRLG